MAAADCNARGGHDCPHPIEDYAPDGLTVWTCPDCGRVWEAHVDIWWAPAEDAVGAAVYVRATP